MCASNVICVILGDVLIFVLTYTLTVRFLNADLPMQNDIEADGGDSNRGSNPSLTAALILRNLRRATPKA